MTIKSLSIVHPLWVVGRKGTTTASLVVEEKGSANQGRKLSYEFFTEQLIVEDQDGMQLL